MEPCPDRGVDSLFVSWTGSKTWLEALRQIGEAYQLRFVVDWDRKLVYSDRQHESAAESAEIHAGKG
jgi:uncharacterized protein (DUF2336 family)